mgnify:FL=1
MKRNLLLLLSFQIVLAALAVDLKRCRIVVSDSEVALVKKMAVVLSDDIERVADVRPSISARSVDGPSVILATADNVSGWLV